ncbi:angiotensin-converting enzyme isoform X2 [Condylostylus longicornis]|nr:angiotensin-converting enzyme isoform X2 [Condylostylus longicornis]
MNDHYEKLREIFDSSHQKYSQINTGPVLQETMANYREFLIDLSNKLSSFRISSFKNETLKRRCKLLCKLQLEGLPKQHYDKVMTLLRVMKQFATIKNVCSYEAKVCTDRDNVAYVPKIKEVILMSKIPQKLSYYWKEWRDTIGPVAREYFLNYTDYFRQTAHLNGHITPSRTWYLYYETPNFLMELEHAIKQIEPLYKELHAYVRYNLIKKYPGVRLKPNKPIPQHLMEQVIEHSWRSVSVFEVPFPKLHLPNIKIKLDQQKYTSKTINEVTEEFYKSLDMQNLPDSLWEKYARMISEDEYQGECKADILYYPPEVALKYCPKITYKYFLQMHGQMGELHYNYRRGQLPFGLDREACPGFGKAISEAAVISAGCPRYLNRIGLIGNDSLTTELSMNRLFRMGVHTIFGVMQHFVNEKFWVMMLDGKIKPEKMNCKYWDIQEEYAGVSAPVERTNLNFDVSYKFFDGIDPSKAVTIKLVSELMGYQINRALCIESGHYVPGDPKYPLHNCDFSDSNKSGKYLEEAMHLGSKKNWRDVLENLTGEREISANAILEYYYPLYVWVKEQNEQNEVETGWNDSYMCEEEV